jgi:DNA-binding NtrC family response regulator
VEDDVQIAAALENVLHDEGYETVHALDGKKGLALATGEPCDLVLTDFRLPGLSGLELVKRLHESKPKLPVVLMTAHGTTATAIEATKLGAYDYLIKPFEMPDLLTLVAKGVECNRMMAETIELGAVADGHDAIIGNSRPMQEIYKEIGRIAAKPVPVLIRGETGTGKELIARAIYQHSERADRPFIAVNCAAIPETLLESELFGHEKGAFTGADARKIGRFEQAAGGTIFLDEIGDMTLTTQAKLLRVLQEKCVQRVGGTEVIPIDSRVIAATHRDLEKAIEEKEFREDLFYRLNVVCITIPPLRRRAGDIAELARYFLTRYATDFGVTDPSIQTAAIQFLEEQPWVGNVRELENVVRKALLLARGYAVDLAIVREALGASRKPPGSGEALTTYVAGLLEAASRGETENVHAAVIEAAEREMVAQAIKLAQGNQAKAARWLGVSRITMREKLLQFGMHPGQG